MTFDEAFRNVYAFTAPSIEIGHVLHEGKPNAIDRESAHEILQRKIAESAEAPEAAGAPRQEAAPRGGKRADEPKSMVEEVLSSRVVQTAARQAARSVTQQGRTRVVRNVARPLKEALDFPTASPDREVQRDPPARVAERGSFSNWSTAARPFARSPWFGSEVGAKLKGLDRLPERTKKRLYAPLSPSPRRG